MRGQSGMAGPRPRGGERAPKLLAILNVVAWAGFWAFGYLALTGDPAAPGEVTTAALLAALGGAAGLWAWLKLARRGAENRQTEGGVT